MPNLRAILTLVVTAAWLLSMNHCRLEALPWLSFLPCPSSAQADPCHDHECTADPVHQEGGAHACDELEKSLFRSGTTRFVLPQPPVVDLPFAGGAPSAPLPVAATSDILLPSGHEPPEGEGVWIFLTRSAALPRSPGPLA